MSLKHLLFPAQSRLFRGQRWVNIGLRTLHLIGLAGLGAGFLYPVDGDMGYGYFYLTITSGIGLVMISTWSNAIWLIQLRGQAILLKVLLLLLIPLVPALTWWLFVAVIVISGLISHAPGAVRYYSIFHRRRIEQL